MLLTFRSVATDSQLVCTTNQQTHTPIYCTRHPTQHTSRTPSLTRNSLDWDVFVATTLTSLRKQRKCSSSSRHAVIPIQFSTTANTAHNQSIRNRHHFRHTTNKREESHSHSHFTHITYQSKTSSEKISSYFSTIPPLPRFLRNLSSFHTNGTINPAHSNVRAYDVGVVLSSPTRTKSPDLSD